MSDRYINAEVTKVRFVTAIADLTAPTITEINGGTKLDDVIKGITGFTKQTDDKEAPDLGHRFIGTVRGTTKAGSSSIEIYRSTTSGDLEETAATALSEGATGFIVFYDKAGIDTAAIATTKCDIWPVTVRNKTKKRDGAMDDTSTRTVEFAVTAPPKEDVAAVAGS